jgi:hypothetical protein
LGQYIPFNPTFRELKMEAAHSSASLITKFSERKLEAAGFSEPLIHTRLYGVIPETTVRIFAALKPQFS